jgi:hypothetical protein
LSHLRFCSTPGLVKLSSTVTGVPAAARRSAKFVPMKPAPPVINTFPRRGRVEREANLTISCTPSTPRSARTRPSSFASPRWCHIPKWYARSSQ